MSIFFPNPSSSLQALSCKNDTQIIKNKSCENENKTKILEYVSSFVFTDDDSSDSDDDPLDSDDDSSDSDDDSSDSDEEPLDRPIKQRRVSSSSSENLKPWPRYISKGEKMEVTSLLCSSSRNFLVNSEGDKIKVSSIKGKGKYTLIHCFELPVDSYSTLGEVCWALKHVFSKCSDLQFVVVPKLRKGCEAADEGAQLLKSFLAAFQSQSSYCLAVPIWDSVSYDRISGFIKEAVLLDPNGVVLQRDSEFIMRYGAESFPFTDDRLYELVNNGCDMVDERPVRIENLLGLPLSATMFNAAGDDTVSVSDLKDRLVGLYLCRDGRLMDSINQRCQYCEANSLELVIVLVYLPLSDDPSHFMAYTKAALSKKGISSWWLSPFNDSVSRRLWQLYEHSSCTRERDELIMVGPRGEYLDYMSAANIFYSGSVKDMYPYAAEALARQETERLKKLTLDSLSLSVNCSLVRSENGHGVPVPLEELQGKTVCLFIANGDDWSSYGDQCMKGWCEENANGNKPNFVLVFVPLHMPSSSNLNSDPRRSWLWDSTMSWLICPPDPVREASIIKHTTLRGLKLPELSFLTFGEDGKLLSIAFPNLVGDFPTIQLYEEVLESYTDRFSE